MTSDRHLALMNLMREITAPAKTYDRCTRRAAASFSNSPQYDKAVALGNSALDDIEQAVRRWVAANPEPGTAAPLLPADQTAAPSAAVRQTLRRWAYAAGHIEAELDGVVDRMYELIARDVRRMADETATTEMPAVDLPTLAAALDGLGTLLATSSRDWGVYRVDAWLYAVILGWDCEQTEHDDTCTHGALEEMQERHGWDDATVTKARRYRAAVRALVETYGRAAGARQDEPDHVCNTVQTRGEMDEPLGYLICGYCGTPKNGARP
ncbi:hypothetical protein [Streptomyces sp. SudanB91_2054]|uniref:hypothetical protein n=1 Tax=Streptomyces sp. SudanB91_2054 TaxID=3035278 RepID=UPI0036D885A4